MKVNAKHNVNVRTKKGRDTFATADFEISPQCVTYTRRMQFLLFCFVLQQKAMWYKQLLAAQELRHQWQSIMRKPAPRRRGARKDQGAEFTVHNIKAYNINGK